MSPKENQAMSPSPSTIYQPCQLLSKELNEDVESFLHVYTPQGCNKVDGEMQLKWENKWCRFDSKSYLKAIMLVLLLAIFTATLLILFVKFKKEPVGEIYTEKVFVYPDQTSGKPPNLTKQETCQDIAQRLSGFNGCSIPDWMPKELVNTQGKSMMDSISKYWWSSEDPSGEHYDQIFKTDCNKHDICYGCGTYYNLSRSDCDNFFHKDMIETCDKQYSSTWLNVIRKSLGGSEYEVDQKEMCVEKAGHFKKGVEIGGEERYTGEESWCQEPCVVEYLLGSKLFQPKSANQIDCGNGVTSESCSQCKESGEPQEWCGGDCEWDGLFENCKKRTDDNEYDSMA